MKAELRRVGATKRQLLADYRGVLRKDRARQGLLKAELGMTKVRHWVISRFPVLTGNQAIIAVTVLDRLRRA